MHAANLVSGPASAPGSLDGLDLVRGAIGSPGPLSVAVFPEAPPVCSSACPAPPPAALRAESHAVAALHGSLPDIDPLPPLPAQVIGSVFLDGAPSEDDPLGPAAEHLLPQAHAIGPVALDGAPSEGDPLSPYVEHLLRPAPLM